MNSEFVRSNSTKELVGHICLGFMTSPTREPCKTNSSEQKHCSDSGFCFGLWLTNTKHVSVSLAKLWKPSAAKSLSSAEIIPPWHQSFFRHLMLFKPNPSSHQMPLSTHKYILTFSAKTLRSYCLYKSLTFSAFFQLEQSCFRTFFLNMVNEWYSMWNLSDWKSGESARCQGRRQERIKKENRNGSFSTVIYRLHLSSHSAKQHIVVLLQPDSRKSETICSFF